jgi:diguanylate cyclase (GGDEF)-like protein
MDFRVLPKSFIHFLFGSITRLDDLDAQARGRVRAAQISAVVQLVLLTMTVNVVNAAVISFLFWDTGVNAFLIIWSSLIGGVVIAAFLSWRRTWRKPPKTTSERGVKRLYLHATILGAVWGAVPLALFPESDTMHQLFLAAMMTGMISGGAFGLSTVPKAGLAYTWTIVLASAASLFAASYDVFNYTAVMLIILDQFKSINDTLGHPVGDALLKLAAKRIRSCVCDRDIVARLGGDEFAILQTATEMPTGAMMLARMILDAFKEPFKPEHGEMVIETTIGIAVAPGDGWAADALLKKADLALYAGKADGGTTYRFFEPEMEAWAHRRRALEVGLRSALENKEIQVMFQPQVDLRRGAVVGCEALVRWKSAEWGMVSPAEFIPVAEAMGLIEPIGEFVLREAVKAASRWPNDAVVAVNLSPVQFKN